MYLRRLLPKCRYSISLTRVQRLRRTGDTPIGIDFLVTKVPGQEHIPSGLGGNDADVWRVSEWLRRKLLNVFNVWMNKNLPALNTLLLILGILLWVEFCGFRIDLLSGLQAAVRTRVSDTYM